MSEDMMKLTADYDQLLAKAVEQIKEAGPETAGRFYRELLQRADIISDPESQPDVFIDLASRFAIVGFLAAAIALSTKGEPA